MHTSPDLNEKKPVKGHHLQNDLYYYGDQERKFNNKLQ